MKIAAWLKPWYVRVSEGIVACLGFASAVFGLSNIKNSKSIDMSIPTLILGIVIASLAGLLWIYTEISIDEDIGNDPISKADENLMKDFDAIFEIDLVKFLSTHDFYYPFQTTHTDKIGRFLYYWREPRFSFANAELERSLSAVKKDAETFYSKIGQCTVPRKHNVQSSEVVKNFNDSDETTTLTNRRIKELNELASQLYASISKLHSQYVVLAN